jgi:DNA adenine methylase
VIIDNNLELINCYKVIKNNANELIDSLKNYKYDKDSYYKIRALDQNLDVYNNLSNVEKAARTIFLNKTGYNGLYRVNSKGQFNVPFGRHKNPKICDKDNLKAVHKAIQKVEILHGSFEICLNYAKGGDFVYLDPPYYPLSDTALFTSYTKENFGKESQVQLHEVFKQLDERGCKLLLSNSYCDFILDLYKDYKIITIKAKRAINSDSSKRGFINEVLIMN